jgi:ribosomal protein S27AE
MYCEACQAFVPADANFCSNCGVRIGAVTGPTTRLDQPAAATGPTTRLESTDPTPIPIQEFQLSKEICSRCGGTSELGFILDRAPNGQNPPLWYAGQPQQSVLHGGANVTHLRARSIRTYRCTICGYLESYAGVQ